MTTFDLHIHTTASDGVFSPQTIVSKAKVAGLKAIAITDHDTIDGIEEAINKAKTLDILVIPGIELSTDYLGKEIHILGYFMNWHDDAFKNRLISFRKDRKERAQKMVLKLQELGYNITFDEVVNFSKGASIGRPHIAQALVAKGLIRSISEAFDKLLSRGKPAYIPREKLTPKEAVKFIKDFLGIPVIAHPGLAQMDNIIPELVEIGLMGIEVYHPEHSKQDVLRYKNIAEKNRLLITGGSDYHGIHSEYKSIMGVPEVDFSIITKLLDAKEQIDNATCRSNY